MTGVGLLDEIGDTTDLTLVRGPGGEDGPELAWARDVLSEHIYHEIGLEDLASGGGHTALLATGEWRRQSDQLLPYVLSVAELRFQRVIVLPTRFDTSDDEIREALMRTRATIFAADRTNYARIVSLCDARPAEDGALRDIDVIATARIQRPASLAGAGTPSGAATPAGNGRATDRVTAVILTRDRPDAASRAVASVRAGTQPAHVLVIDNNSAAPAAADLRRALGGEDNVSLWRSDRNLGCGGGRQLGVDLSRSELVLLLDDDAELEPDALELLVRDLDAHPAAVAVSATVSTPDRRVHHSGGSIGFADGVADFSLLGTGRRCSDDSLPPTGPSSWVPGTTLLVRRSALDEFPIDAGMLRYYEDNEWCHRVALARPNAFRRSREARATHNVRTEPPLGRDFAARAKAVRLLEPHARFYDRHGQLLGPTVFDLVPELRDADGRCDVIAARLLMELLLAKGTPWVLSEWMNRGLAVLLESSAARADGERALAAERFENQRLREQVAARDAHIAELATGLGPRIKLDAGHLRYLRQRHELLTRVEQGGWWRLRQRLLPGLRLFWRLRGR